MLYDTLKMAQELEGPFSREQATALTKALSVSTADTFATKGDITVLRSEIKDLRAELKGDIAGLKSEIAGLKNEIAGITTDMVKWIVGAIAFNLFGTAGLILTLSKYTH